MKIDDRLWRHPALLHLYHVMDSPSLPRELHFELRFVQLHLMFLIAKAHGYAPLTPGPKRIDLRRSQNAKALKRQRRRRDR